jgi:parvulin-like peptidyl-prolyl isomerase
MLARERGLLAGNAPAADAVEPLLAAKPVPEPTAAEIAAYFAAHSAEFARPARVHLRQILVDDRLAAERARRELLAGSPFETVLAKVSVPGSAPAGGDQGILARDELPPAFAELIFRLEVGKVSEVVPADYGYHLFQVVERWPAESAALEEVAPAIRQRLREASADARLQALFADAQSRYTVVVYDRNLPFNYRGSFPISRPHEER